jgi:hypothetical protein
MKSIGISIILAFVFLLTACVPSLNPLYTEQDLVFDKSILGVWTDDKQTETWEFVYVDEKEYKLVHTDEDGKKGEFEARLLKIEGKLFLDIAPVRSQLGQNDFYNGHLLSTHSFIQVSQEGKTFRLSYLESKWLKQYLEKNPGAVRHTSIDGEILFTDSTKNLQKFIAANLNTPGAFSNTETFKRKEAAK